MTPQAPDSDPLQGLDPDYTQVSLDELQEVRRRIDAARFPDRARAVDMEIARRLASPDIRRASRKPPAIRYARRVVAAAEVLGGFLGMIAVLSMIWSLVIQPRIWSFDTWVLLGIFVGYLALDGCAVYAGRLLWRFQGSGLVLTQIVLALQCFSIQAGGFQYTWAFPWNIFVYVPSGEITFRFGSLVAFAWDASTRPFNLGVNLVPLAMLGSIVVVRERNS